MKEEEGGREGEGRMDVGRGESVIGRDGVG